MTGKITVGTIQDTDGNTVASTYVTNGVAKAWVKYNQSTPGVDNSLNVSSVTDNATAKYTINYTSNWANINYTNTTGGSYNGSDGTGSSAFGPRHQTPTTSAQIMLASYGSNATAADWVSNETSHNGDLA
jgi:hypothetical protein